MLVHCKLNNSFVKSQFHNIVFRRNFSIIERYLRAVPNADELKGSVEVGTVDQFIKEKKGSTYFPPSISRGTIPKEAYLNIFCPPKQPEQPKFLKVVLVGAPNSGKSSLLNCILNKTVSAVSPKVNTTQNNIKGVFSKNNTQIVFFDCPGILPSHKKSKFCKILTAQAWKGYEEADLILFLVDVVKKPSTELFDLLRVIAPKENPFLSSDSESESESESDMEEEEEEKKIESILWKDIQQMEQQKSNVKTNFLENRRKLMESYDKNQETNEDQLKNIIPPVILVLNKVDLCTHSKWANARAKEFLHHANFDNLFFISAKYNKGVDELLDYLMTCKMKNGLWVYPEETYTTLTKVQVVEQLVKTYLFCWFNKDVPYKLKHNIISWIEQPKSIVIEYQIIVKNEKVAKMICGIHNKLIINMRKNVSYKLTKLWNTHVYVYIHVKALSY